MTERWPDWSTAGPADLASMENLARYVRDMQERDFHFGDVEASASTDPASNRTIVLRLYERLVERRIGYRWEPFVESPATEGGVPVQRIRYPTEVMRWGGTCIDLAVLFACLCFRYDLRPLLVVLPRHAVVMVAIDAPANDSVNRSQTWRQRSSEGWSIDRALQVWAEEAAPGVWRKRDGAPVTANRRLMLLDPTCAVPPSRNGPAHRPSLTDAREVAREEVEQADWAVVVDPLTLQRRLELRPYDPPQAIPTLYTQLPQVTSGWTDYPSRLATTQRLAGLTQGPVVVQGESGLGKSFLALRRARGVDSGFGWLLERCARPEDLIDGLARRYAHEHQQEPPTTKADRDSLAFRARNELNESSAPWVVVVDGADDVPEAFEPYLPVPDRPGQVLLVTTTNRAWLGWAGRNRLWTALEIEPLKAGDVTLEGIPADLAGHLAQSPLLSQVAAAIAGALTVPAGSGAPSSVAEAAAVLVRRLVDAEPEAEAVAGVLSSLRGLEIRLEELLRILGAAAETTVDRLVGEHVLNEARLGEQRLLTMHEQLAGPARDLLGNRRFTWGPREAPVRIPYGMAAVCDPRLFARLPGSVADEIRNHVPEGELEARKALFRALERRGQTAAAEREANFLLAHRPRVERQLELDALLAAVRRTKDQSNDLQRIADDTSRVDAAIVEVASGISGAVPAGNIEGAARTLVAAAKDAEPGSQVGRMLLLGAQLLAMRGLLDRRRVHLEVNARRGAGASRAELAGYDEQFIELLRRLRESRDVRVNLLADETDPLVHQAEFNLSGTYCVEAQVAPPERVPAILEQAMSSYEKVLAIRVGRYGADHLHTAACVFGQALVSYLRAVFTPDLSPVERYALLDAGAGFAIDSLDVRRRIEGGPGGSDAAKSLHLLIKIRTAQQALAAGVEPAARAIATTQREVSWELSNALPPLAVL